MEALKEDPNLGAANRWTVQAKTMAGLHLVLQCLPATAGRLRADPRLSADDGLGIQIETIDLDTEMLDGEPGPCPVPILLAREPPDTRDCLGDSPENVLTGTGKVFKARFLGKG